MRHDIDCDPDRFWEIFFDAEFQKGIFLKELGFPQWEVTESKDSEKETTRVVKAQPKMEVPGAVQKLLGSGFGYTENGTFDKASKVYKFVITPTTLADKLTNTGTVKFESKGPGKGTRVVDVLLEAKVFGVGGMIEKMTEKSFRDGWQKSAEIINAKVRAEAK